MTIEVYSQCTKTFSEASSGFTMFTTTMLGRDAGGSDTSTTLTIIDTANDENFCDLRSTCTLERLNSPPSVISSGTAYALPTLVYWQSSDLSAFPSAYASSLAAVLKIPFGNQTTTSHSSSPTSTPTSTPIPSNISKSSTELSPGAQAGIGVGVVAAVILSVIALLYLWRRHKRQRQRIAHSGISEMEGGSNGLKRFLGGKWRAETDGTSEPVEAESRSIFVIPGPPVELEDTRRGEAR
jgi:hypothetical protein